MNNKLINKNGFFALLHFILVRTGGNKKVQNITIKVMTWIVEIQISKLAHILNSLLAWTSREIVGWTPFLLLFIQLDLNNFNIKKLINIYL